MSVEHASVTKDDSSAARGVLSSCPRAHWQKGAREGRFGPHRPAVQVNRQNQTGSQNGSQMRIFMRILQTPNPGSQTLGPFLIRLCASNVLVFG